MGHLLRPSGRQQSKNVCQLPTGIRPRIKNEHLYESSPSSVSPKKSCPPSGLRLAAPRLSQTRLSRLLDCCCNLVRRRSSRDFLIAKEERTYRKRRTDLSSGTAPSRFPLPNSRADLSLAAGAKRGRSPSSHPLRAGQTCTYQPLEIVQRALHSVLRDSSVYRGAPFAGPAEVSWQVHA